MPKAKVLVIEDDRSISEVLAYNFRAAAWDVIVASDGQDGLLQAQTKSPDVIILDLMLPVIDGLEVCRRLRAKEDTKEIPIVMLTAKSEESDELVGFAMGADDYVTKPFSIKVLLERVRVLRQRSTREPATADVTSRDGITVDRRRHEVTIGDRVVPLTRTEFRLLDTLISQPERVFDRIDLMDAALGPDSSAEERTIDVHIRGLRRKLEDHACYIETVRGVGYRFGKSLAAQLAGE